MSDNELGDSNQVVVSYHDFVKGHTSFVVTEYGLYYECSKCGLYGEGCFHFKYEGLMTPVLMHWINEHFMKQSW